MNILIAAGTYSPQYNPTVFLSENLIRVLAVRGHKTAVAAAEGSRFHSASFYPLPSHAGRCFLSNHADSSCEEELYKEHVLSLSFLRKDLQVLNQAIDEFKPDLILEMEHPCAVIASKLHSIPCCSVVDAAMYKDEPVPWRTLKNLNTILRENHQEQILHLSDLCSSADMRIAFGTQHTQPFSAQDDVMLYGNASGFASAAAHNRRITILSASRVSSRFTSIIHEAFSGASYDVRVFYPGCRAGKDNNIQFLPGMRPYLIQGSDVCIHDGSPYLFNQCLSAGIRQLVISDDSWQRRYNADMVKDLGCGIVLKSDRLKMENLYEKYRQLCSSDLYQENAERIAEEISRMPSLYDLVTDLEHLKS